MSLTWVFESHNGSTLVPSFVRDPHIHPNPGLSSCLDSLQFMSMEIISCLFVYCAERSIPSFLHSSRECLLGIFTGEAPEKTQRMVSLTCRLLMEEEMWLFTPASSLAMCDCINSWARVRTPVYARLNWRVVLIC